MPRANAAVIAALLAAATGCGGKKPRQDQTCAVAVKRIIELGETPPDGEGYQLMARVETALIALCQHGAWSQQVINCRAYAPHQSGLANCRKLMTEEQRYNEDRLVKEVYGGKR